MGNVFFMQEAARASDLVRRAVSSSADGLSPPDSRSPALRSGPDQPGSTAVLLRQTPTPHHVNTCASIPVLAALTQLVFWGPPQLRGGDPMTCAQLVTPVRTLRAEVAATRPTVIHHRNLSFSWTGRLPGSLVRVSLEVPDAACPPPASQTEFESHMSLYGFALGILACEVAP